jgi:outer membrane protein OmpA-like peptidoglycan-associated protein
MESSIATVLGGLAVKSDEPGTLRKMLDLVPGISGGLSWSQLAGDVTSAASPMIAGGKRILSGLFGGSEGAITNAISHDSGLGSGATSSILAMAAPMVMGLLNKKVRDGDLTMSSLATSLKNESATIRGALPSGVSDLIWRRTAGESPVIAQTVKQESSSAGWLWALGLCALALGCLWLFTHGRRAAVDIGSAATGAANRLADEAKSVGSDMKRHVPEIRLKNPNADGETRLLAFVRDNNAMPNDTTWIAFDRLRFDSGSAKLKPASADQLDDVAAIFVAYPSLRAKIGGYTDSKGSDERNLALSEARADTVKSQLVARGIGAERLTAEGYGEKYAVADNSTEAGRAENRRVALQITDK